MELIVEMEMPKNCMECAFSTGCSFCEGYDDYCVLAPRDAEYEWNFSDGIEPSDRPSWCPIVGVLPDEHGDLIDRDAAKTRFENKKSTIQNRIMGVQMDSIAIAFYEIFIEAIDKQPTVIAAERKDDGTTTD